jgi:hypothetical protein
MKMTVARLILGATSLLSMSCAVEVGADSGSTEAAQQEPLLVRAPTRPLPIPGPVDGPWIPYSGGGAAPGDQFRPSVASNGRDFFAVWSDRRDGVAEVYGARIASDGSLLDPHGVLIAIAPVESYDVHAEWRYERPAVAFDGVNYVVVWSDARTAMPSVYMRHVVPATGLPLEPDATAITPGLDAVEPAVACNGPSCLVTFSVHTRTFFDDGRPNEHLKLFGIFPAALRPAGPFQLTIAPQNVAWESQASIATNGSGFVVAFTEWLANPQPDIFVVPVTPGIPVDAGLGYPVSTYDISVGFDSRTPSIASDGGSYLVAFRRWGSVFGVRLGPSGTPLDDWYGIPLSHGPGSNPSVAFNGTDYFVAWDREAATETAVSNVFGVRVSPAGGISPSGYDYYFALDANQQQHPSIAANPTGELLVWQELVGGDWDVRGTTISTAGTAAHLDGLLYSPK